MKGKEIKAVKMIAGAGNDYVSHSKATGAFTLKRTYFYTYGRTPKMLAEKLAARMSIKVIETGDTYRAWPKTSFHWVEFVPEDVPAVMAKANSLADHLGMTFDELWQEHKDATEVIR